MGEILVKCALARSRKGMRLIFLKLDVDIKWQHKRTWQRQGEPLEELSFLFNRSAALKWDYPELGRQIWKSASLSGASGALATVHENPDDIVSHQVVPITASGLQG